MENFKRTLKRRITLLTLPLFASVALSIYNVFFASATMKESHIYAFQCGFSVSLCLFSVFFIFRFRAILRDETQIKLQYNKENDERLKAIRAKAGIPMLLITSVGLLIAAIIAGYFNPTVFFALATAAISQMILSVIAKAVYMCKM